jgi:hypothetical protein
VVNPGLLMTYEVMLTTALHRRYVKGFDKSAT